ncbi:hypothetical protein HZH66_006868 [Vespula vulgaris]|uniref:Uncharacterized protein n=1 Tax=Vespula vulgaris TaxID=7454 RepID=A0A834K7W9_VESVU|nr:hypothetical protein HZH66_006868 [Vespula vulgaris]
MLHDDDSVDVDVDDNDDDDDDNDDDDDDDDGDDDGDGDSGCDDVEENTRQHLQYQYASGSNSSGVSGKRVRADILPLWHYASLSFCKASKRKLNRGLGWNKSERCLWVVPCQVHWLLFALNFQLYSLSLNFTHNANWREARYHVQNGGKQPGNIEDIV